MILSSDDVGFVPDRVGRLNPWDGISPSTAACIVREFQRCPNCNKSLDPDVTNSTHVDRDVEWDGEHNLHGEDLTCDECNSQFRVLVEEKTFGKISESQLPEWAEVLDDVFFIECEDSASYCVINSHQIMVSER